MRVKTYFLKARHGKIRWHLVDADGVVLGRLAARIARVLTGKDFPDWTPFADHREGIVVINAEKVRLTGRKLDQKLYRHYTGYPGGLREISARQLLGACSSKGELQENFNTLRALAGYEPADAVTLRRRIAGRLLSAERYVV